jgi:nucleoside-diphosphate-sugar epimerase
MSRVLVTGAGGFIGRRATSLLAEHGHEVHGVGRGQADLLQPGAAAELMAAVRPSHLLHLAWYAEHGKFWTSPENVHWVEASVALMRAFIEAGGQRAVGAGSCAEYQWGGHGPLSEDGSPVGPATLYGVCKNEVRELSSGLAEEAGVSFGWGRIFFLYAADEDPRRLVASVARAVVAGEPAETSSGEQLRDFMHADDVAAGLVALLESNVEGPVNVASGEPIAVRDLALEIGRAAGREDLVRVGALPQRPGEPPEIVADVQRLRDEVGFTPAIGLAEGVARTVEELRARLEQRA